MRISLSIFSVVLFLVLVNLADFASAGVSSWSFTNWNKYKSNPSNESAAWRKVWKITKWGWPHKEAKQQNNAIVKDPATSKEYVLKVTYPKGSNNPASSPQGGIGFYAVPISVSKLAKVATLEYKVYFPKGFKFVKGGKLPGLYGGHVTCTGGIDATNCFSARFMWRTNGDGEVYTYMPESKQRSNLCDEKHNVCNSGYGYSLGRGTWKFATGRWTTVQQTLKLNTPDKMDGTLTVMVDGKVVFVEPKLAFRAKKTGTAIGIAFHTFFGGSGKEWSTPKLQNTFFKDFKLKITT